MFSSPCGTISRRLRFAVRSSSAAIRETPRFKESTIGFSHPAFAARDAHLAPIERLQAAAGGTAATEPDNSAASFKTTLRTYVEHNVATLSRECWFFK